MTKTKKRIIAIIAVIGILSLLGLFGYKLLTDETRLTSKEKDWIANNTSNVQNIHVLNDVEIVGDNGKGVFFDFINDIKAEYNITINPITYNRGEEVENPEFKIVTSLNDRHLVFKEEHYVLIGAPNKKGYNLESANVGVLASEEDYIKKYVNKGISFNGYNTYSELYEALNKQEDIQYALIPLDENLSTVLKSNYTILKHYGDIKKYFVYEMPEEVDEFNSIIKKYYLKYKEDKLDKEIATYTLETIISALDISEKDLKAAQAHEYNYGFVNNSPYEVLIGGNYGGIVSEYLKAFSEVTNTEFKYVKYKNMEAFKSALKDEKIDIYFNYYNIENDYNSIESGLSATFNVLTKVDDYTIINSIQSLRDKDVYVKEDSLLLKQLEEYDFLNIKTYKDTKQLKKLLKKDIILFIDSEEYDYYRDTLFEDYNVKFSGPINESYEFKLKNKDTFYILFNKYISLLDNKEMVSKGIYNHNITVKNGTLAGKVTKYSLIIIIIILLVIIIIYRSTKKIKIVKKIKKVDKIKYIDQLTSLKNRNYLNENIGSWNNNTIYPQATIVIDLDNLQNINDTLGYDAGDDQIKAAANILIKTQLDNSDIVRTDGNEFLIYLVGYQDKQIVSYIRKLYKEFKNLPHEYGATIGYSMILDDIKTIEDAINEAVDDMKEKKEEQE